MKQKKQEYTLKIKKKFSLDLKAIDAWLYDVLNIEKESFKLLEDNTMRVIDRELEQIIWRVLLLARTLFQSIQMPIFDTGYIVEIIQDIEKSQSVKLAVVLIEHIPRKVYLSVINVALNLLVNIMQKPLSNKNTQILFKMIENEVIAPLGKFSGSGKSTLVMLKVAYEKKIPFLHLSNGIYQLGWGIKSRRFNRSIVDTDSAIGAQVAQNKLVTTILLREAALPAPHHSLVISKEEALHVALNLGWPIVVKPSDQDRGEGITTDITSKALLIKAFIYAQNASYSKQVIVEKQVEGICCRIFIVNDKILYAVKRLPKSITADGEQTIKLLIEQANLEEEMKPPWKREKPYLIDELAIEVLNNSGFSLDSIPKVGVVVPLRKVESTLYGGVDEEVTGSIHPDNLEIALRAVKLFGLDVAGIDIITQDISIPWYQNGAIINEVNFSPVLGGGEISRRMVGTYLKEFIDGDGRIPIHVIVGHKESIEKAFSIQKKELLNGRNCFITTHNQTFNEKNEEIHFLVESLFKRTQALLLNKRVASLIIVVQTDEFMDVGFPVDEVDDIVITSENLYVWKNKNKRLEKEKYTAGLKILNSLISKEKI